MGIESSAFHQREIFTCLSNDTRVDIVARLVRVPLPSTAAPPSCVLCSSLHWQSQHPTLSVLATTALQNEHAPILHSARIILLSEQRLILHSAYVILSEHEPLFSEHLIPHSAHAIPLSEQGPILHSAHVILLREHRLILHSACT